MSFDSDTLQFTRDKRFETYADTEDGDDIEQTAFDAVLDDLYVELNEMGTEVYSIARRYNTKALFLASGADYTALADGDVLIVGDQFYKVVATGAVTYHEITVSGAEGSGGLKVVEAGSKFTSTTTAGQGDTLGGSVLLAAGVPFVYDAAGTDLTTGDGRTWTKVVAGIDAGGTGAATIEDVLTALKMATASVFCTYGGTANVITLTTGRSLTGLTVGQEFRFRASAANTAGVTINVDGIGALTANTPSGTALPPGFIRTDVDTQVRFDGTDFLVEIPDLEMLGALYATYGGTANAITLTTGVGLSALTAGQEVRFRASVANTSAATIDVDGIGAVALKTPDGSALSGGEIRTDRDTVARFDGTDMIVILWPGRLLETTVVDSAGSSSYIVPDGCFRLRVHGVAAGGGGGSGDGDTSGGGDGGAGSGANGGEESIFDIAVVPGQSISYTIGAGGLGSTTAGVDGSAGGDTTVSDGTTTFTLKGGEGGASLNNASAAKATVPNNRSLTTNVSTGAFTLIRNPGKEFGEIGITTPSVAVTGTGVVVGGNGGSSGFGSGGRGAIANSNDVSSNALNGYGNGAGGGGGAGMGQSSVGSGGDGTDGAVEFTAYS